jgi:hypothetical protein
MVVYLAIAIRMLDAYFCTIQFRNIRDYFYFLSLMNHPKCDSSNAVRRVGRLEQLSIPFHRQTTLAYLCTKLIDLVFKFSVYLSIISYFKTKRPLPHTTTFANLASLGTAKDYWLLGLALSYLMECGAFIGLQAASILFKGPLIPLMDNIHLSTSVSDFWASRWNLIVQRVLFRTVYCPFYSLCSRIGCRKMKCRLGATMACFLASAILHEWTIHVMCREKSMGEQFVFFVLQGVLVVLEAVAGIVSKHVLGVNLKTSVPTPLKIVYTNVIMTATAPLFLAPYLREDLHLKIAFSL